MKKLFFLTASLLILCNTAFSQRVTNYILTSPDGQLKANISSGNSLTYDLTFMGKKILNASPLSMKLQSGEVLGQGKVTKTVSNKTDEQIQSPFYRASSVRNQYNGLTLKMKNCDVEFRAFNDGIAYRFICHLKKPYNVEKEQVEYHFPKDAVANVPYADIQTSQSTESRYRTAFESTYTTAGLSKLDTALFAFLPLSVDIDGVKVCISESHVESFPGLFLNYCGNNTLRGIHATYPKTEAHKVGYNNIQARATAHEPFEAKCQGERSFPWRMAIVGSDDKTIAQSNMTYLLAAPGRVKDISWIKPGLVAWDWWSNWDLEGVDFKAGINNDTYKYYIDFAQKFHIPYILLDEGWSKHDTDLVHTVADIDLPMLINYGKERGVGLLLWMGWDPLIEQMDEVCKRYSEMGIKGIKVDFMNRDDQKVMEFDWKLAATCAKYHLILDLHGNSKPAGLTRTYPNVLNVEGVFGMEQLKFGMGHDKKDDPFIDQVHYDCMIPFLRQVGGPLDYTPGAMRNASKSCFSSIYSGPMSQGTRCHQMALYVVFDAPLAMLCDAATNYLREAECTQFLSAIPTVWDETRVLDSKMGEYAVFARRKGNTWYVAAISDWTPRDLTVDLSFLKGNYQTEIFQDGVNAYRRATDYKRLTGKFSSDNKLSIHLESGGGYVCKLTK